MRKKQRTEIRFETHEVTIIRFRQTQSATRFCAACRASVRHLPISRAAAILRISETEVFRLVESKQIHSTETETGELLVCQNSLEKQFFLEK